MLWFYKLFFPVVWLLFLLYWPIKARNTNAATRLEPRTSRILRAIVLLVAIGLFSVPNIQLPWLYHQLWPVGFWSFWLGAVGTVTGLVFAVWAREHLGKTGATP